MTTTHRPALLSALNVRYELTSDAREHLGAEARDIWTAALTTELERAFPGCNVDVTTMWSNVDASRYSIEGETTDGSAVAGSKLHLGALDVSDATDDQSVSAATLALITDRIVDADHDAWERACASGTA